MIEVTAAEDERRAADYGALARGRGTVRFTQLQSGWLVYLREGAKIREVKRRLPTLLVEMEQAGLTDLVTSSGWFGGDLEDLRERLWASGVAAVYEHPNTGPGVISMTGAAYATWLSTDPDDVVSFVESLLEAVRPGCSISLSRCLVTVRGFAYGTRTER